MIETRDAQKQVLRLSSLHDFPRGTDEMSIAARNELVKALRGARDADHAEQMISGWLQSTKFSPKPSEIYELLAKDASTVFDPSAPVCGECKGALWVRAIGGVKRCSCFGKGGN